MSSSKEALTEAKEKEFWGQLNEQLYLEVSGFERGWQAAVKAMLEYFAGVEVVGDDEDVRGDIQNMHKLFYRMLERWVNE